MNPSKSSKVIQTGADSVAYPKAERKGKPLAKTDFSEADLKRFWSKVDMRGPDECWEWTGCLENSGYGKFFAGPRIGRVFSHRAAFVLENKNLKSGELALHSCDNRKCVNPNHLFSGSYYTNNIDALNKGKLKTTLTPETVRYIRNSTLSPRKTAKELGISRRSVKAIRRRERWSHIQ
jgi:hypothetical protein